MQAMEKQLLPREKLQKLGASALSDAELLALFLRTGVAGKHVLVLAAELLETFGSLYQVMTADKTAFEDVKGVGTAKLTQLYAVAELARRYFNTQMMRESVLTNPQMTQDFLQSMLAHQEREIFMVLFLDNQHRLISAQSMFSGSINSVEVHPREIVREALKLNAAAVILAHNHPSGCAEPSGADRAITARVHKACLLMEVRVLDHVVVGKGEFVSFAQRGWI
ncbi:JAB domain-containing protein [Paramixta manurensis]|uniref:UPF0758 protein PMPD1_4161 n=1 Tax=Paramixta manurensis TaxID=2740817 RepID=A0A6M8UET3_9GAMM|nr:JAB domain-containing protein [Erwiniaceae bacterium PD-1]